MKVNKSVVIGMVLGGLALSGVAVAGSRGQGFGHGGPRHGSFGHGGFGHGGFGIHALLEDVELTEQQQALLDAAKPAKEQREALRSQREADRALIAAELQKGTPDAARLHALVDERVAERAEMLHEQLDAGLAFYAALTPEQRAQVLDNLEELGEHRKFDGPRRPRGDQDAGER